MNSVKSLRKVNTRNVLTIVIFTVVLLTGCSSITLTATSSASEPSWEPQPLSEADLSVVASIVSTTSGPELALHTQHGDVTFWSGVNLGSTIPGRNPGELAASQEDYARWITQIGELGARFIRNYTILPPSFYDSLLEYNTSHKDMPLYLIQGVYLPDESYVESKDLFASESTALFTEELLSASAAVSGDLQRTQKPGFASGTWSSDISPWLAGWIIGAELDPIAIEASDLLNQNQPEFTGEYFVSTAPVREQTTATERWLAARMDELATAEALRGRSMPIAFSNWPTDDPLDHPSEPRISEDIVSIDANHILPTDRWPGGTFADYHAYPYYPDFLRYEDKLQIKGSRGTIDAYEAYLVELKNHHAQAGIPTVVGEFGVPSSLGKAHIGTNARDEGGHTEQEAMSMDADMMRMMKRIGMAGALVFEWSDEWFKTAWNVAPRTAPVDGERRALWHDALNKEQWFGVLATDAVPAGWRTIYEAPRGLLSLAVNSDPVYLTLKAKFSTVPQSEIKIGFDVLPDAGQLLPEEDSGDAVNEVAVVINPTNKTAGAYISHALNPIYLDGLDPVDYSPSFIGPWDLQQMSLNRSWPSVNGYPARDAEFLNVGELISGTWNPQSKTYNSLATWNISGKTLNIRIPWSMLGMADPSSLNALKIVDGKGVAAPVEAIQTVLKYNNTLINSGRITWEGWNSVSYTERLKSGADEISAAWKETSQ